MTALTVSGDLVHYEVLGRGRPVILLHGMLGSWRYWIPTIQFLQQSFRLYALDLYGFGDSAKKPTKYSLEHQIALVEDFMSQLGVEKCALIGHDIGAIVAAEFARRYPNRVPRLMIVSGPLYDPGDLDRRVPVSRVLLDARPALPKPEEQDFNAPTVMSASAAMRAALREAAASRKPGQSPATAPPPDVTMLRKPTADLPIFNPFKDLLAGGMEPLLARSFKRGEPNYDKLSIEVARSDPRAAPALTDTFDAGSLLDTFRLLPMPTVIIHGVDDSVTPAPNEAVLNYLTVDKEQSLLAILLPTIRHFPMLEEARFHPLVKECLDASDVSKIELKERWNRRSR